MIEVSSAASPGAVPGDSFSELAVPAPDGKAVAYFDSTVRSEQRDTIQFRDVTTGELGGPIATGHSNWGADWRPDGEQFATAEADGFVRVWDWRRGDLIVERKVAQGYVGGIAYTHDGRRIVVGERSGAVFQVDAETLTPVGDRVELDREVREVFTAPDGRTVLVLLTGDAYASIDLVEGNVEYRDDLGVDPAWLDVSPDGTRLAVGATTGEVGVIDLASGEWVRPPIDAHGGWVQRVAYAPDGATFASSGNDGQVTLWDGRTGEQLATLVPGGPNVMGRRRVPARRSHPARRRPRWRRPHHGHTTRELDRPGLRRCRAQPHRRRMGRDHRRPPLPRNLSSSSRMNEHPVTGVHLISSRPDNLPRCSLRTSRAPS